MVLEQATGSKDKEVNLRLTDRTLVVTQRLKQQRALDGDPKGDSVIFAATIDTLQRCVLCPTNEGSEQGLALCLSFYSEAKDSYRDICLKKPKDGQELAYHKKKMSELISTILVLREEIVNDQVAFQGGHTQFEELKESNFQLSTTLLNKL